MHTLTVQSPPTASGKLGEAKKAPLGFALLVGTICLIGIGKAINTTLDPDLFWHLRVAEQLRADGIGPLVDRISFASIKEPWTPYSWLAELGMMSIWETLGFGGTIVFQAIAIVGTLVFIALSCVELAGPRRRLNAVVATALAAYLSLAYLSFRPATFAIFFLSIVTCLLLRDRRLGEASRAVWMVVPIAILLTNIHLSVVMIPGWVGSLLAGSWWESNRRSMRRYGVMLIATSIACACTPMLRGAARTAWHYQFHDLMVESGKITEMTPIYTGVWGVATIILIIVLLALALRQRRRIRMGEWLWLIVAALAMLRLGRFSPMFAMIAAPVLAATLPKLSDVVLQKKPIGVAMTLVLVIGLGKSFVQFPRSQTLDAFLDRDEVFGYPAEAARFVEGNIPPGSGRLITDFTWGGYLAWRLGDRYQVLVDGRTQLYSQDFWRATYLGNEETRLALLKDANGDVAVLSREHSIFRKPLQRLGWRTVHADDRAEVLVAPRGSPSTAPNTLEPGSASSGTREAASSRRSGRTPAHPAYAPKN